MVTLEEISRVEAEYAGINGSPSLGKAFELLRLRWSEGARDRETALRLMFLCWYRHAEPTWLTGLPEEGEMLSLLLETFNSLGGVKSQDPEICFTAGLMAEMFGWTFGDNDIWEPIGAELRCRARKLNPAGFNPESFSGRGAYGEYFAHIVRSGVFDS